MVVFLVLQTSINTSSGRFTELWDKTHSPKSRALGKVQNPWVPISRRQWGPPHPKVHEYLPCICLIWHSMRLVSRGSLTAVTAAYLSFPVGAQHQVWTCSQSRKVGLRAVVVTCCHQPNVDKNQVNLWGLSRERSVQCQQCPGPELKDKQAMAALPPLASVHLMQSNQQWSVSWSLSFNRENVWSACLLTDLFYFLYMILPFKTRLWYTHWLNKYNAF